jgi:hypothetical protein
LTAIGRRLEARSSGAASESTRKVGKL